MIVAKQLQGKNDPNSTIIHFYGDGAFGLGKYFSKMLKNNHPLQVLCELGFKPIGDLTWIKENGLDNIEPIS